MTTSENGSRIMRRYTGALTGSPAWVFYGAFGAFYLTQLGIAPAVTTNGIIADDSGIDRFGTDLAGKWPIFLIGAGE